MKGGSGFRKGQIAVIITLVMATLLAVIGLGADIGVFYYQWSLLQKAADSSALAGASELTGNSATTGNSLVTAAATKFAELNGIQQSEIVSITPASDAKSVTVILSRNVSYYFLKVLGLSSGKVAAQAVAAIQPTTGACGYMPIGLPCQFQDYANGHSTCGGKYATGQGISLKADWKNNTQVPGNWEALSLGSSGGSQYRQNIATGFAGAPTASCAGQTSESSCPSSVSTETGNLVGPTAQGFSDRMNGQAYQPVPTGTIDPSSPQIVLAPLVDFKASGKNGKGDAPVLDFVTLWVTAVNGNGDVTATIIPPVPGCGTPTTQATQSNGPYVAILTL
jgi:hypothetical protein